MSELQAPPGSIDDAPDPSTDAARPRYHIRPRSGWLNDPNGVIYWRDRYHVFYQHNPKQASWRAIHWGHVSSPDLVHWQHEPIALVPDPAGDDADGCWSGCVVDDDGVPTLLYTARRQAAEVVCLAYGDPELRTWRKDPGDPVLVAPVGAGLAHFRDPRVWRESDGWHMVIGAGYRGGGGAVLHFRSPDLRRWEELGPAMLGDQAARGQAWECPDLFPLDGRSVLIYSITPGSASTQFVVGSWDGRSLLPLDRGVLDLGPYFYAAQTQLDARGGRIAWGWIREGRSETAQRRAGWSGALSLPRRLTLDPRGELHMVPAPELEALRGSADVVADLHLLAGESWAPDSDAGTAYEVAVTFRCAPGARLLLEVCRSPDGEELTVIECDPGAGEIVVHRERSSLSTDVDREPHAGQAWPERPGIAELRLFVDGSILELFSGSRWLTTRVYPQRQDSSGLRLAALGGAVQVVSFRVWPIREDVIE